MAFIKNERTVVRFGVGEPATDDVAGAEAVATTSFECLIETMDGWELTRPTEDDPEVYCATSTAIRGRDTGQLEVSNLVITGVVDDDPTNGFDAVITLGNQMIINDDIGTAVITEPNGTDKVWARVKVAAAAIVRGGPQDRQRFRIEFIPREYPKVA